MIARDSRVFVADKLSETNKRQLNSRKVDWVELRSEQGFQKFAEILDALKIPHQPMMKITNASLDKIFAEIFK